MTNWDLQITEHVRTLWAHLPERSLCCACVWDRPLVFLRCGHGLCERDAWKHSFRRHPFECVSFFQRCPACDAIVNRQVRLRPPQAGLRIACFDGGGTLGIVSLVSLDSLVRELPLKLQAHHYFDLIVGTSTGSIIAAALGIRKWPLKRCIKEFSKTARQVFYRLTFMTIAPRALRRIWKGIKYSEEPLYAALQRGFGSAPLYGYCDESPDVLRVVITATDFSGRLWLSRSYSPAKLTGVEQASSVSPPESVRESIAASCAAPSYFLPLRGLQDGGFVANNPSAVARIEANRLSRGQMPDYAASFGTGRFGQSNNAHTVRISWQSLVPRWLRRVAKCVSRTFDAELLYDRFVSQLSDLEMERHHRINPTLPCPVVALDDASAIPRLKRMTRERMAQDPTQVSRGKRLRLSLVSSLFYPIITSRPIFDDKAGVYHVTLAVVSRWEDDVLVSMQLQEYLRDACFWIHGWQYKTITPLQVTVMLSSLEEALNIELQVGDGRRSQISGLPLSVNCLINHQLSSSDLRQWKSTGLKRPYSEQDYWHVSKQPRNGIDHSPRKLVPVEF
ncbi:hypothetical protein EYZ11_012061 [Aspergillus tanneri]|nr:hypothetical protein EYZ11_012061 [Aspergillus tanneri]